MIKKTYKFLYLFLIIFGLSGCSAHNPFIITDTIDIKKQETSKYSEHNNSIYVTTASLPGAVEYEVLAILEVGKIWYGSSKNILQSLADGARKVGADAVVDVKTWHQPSGFSWAAPHGSGKAIKVIKSDNFDLNTLSGEWK